MNIVDALVKKMILNHYNTFPTRTHVMNQICLCIGTGFEWVERDGKYGLEVRFDFPNGEKNAIPRFEEDNPHFAKEHDLEHKPYWQANFDYQNMVREWANKNIDVISKQRFHYYGDEPNRCVPYAHCLNYSRMSVHPPVERLHPDWVSAMRDHACDVLKYIREATNYTGGDTQLVDWIKVVRKDLYEPAVVCLKWLEDTHDETKEAAVAELIDRVMSKLKAEESQNNSQ